MIPWYKNSLREKIKCVSKTNKKTDKMIFASSRP